MEQRECVKVFAVSIPNDEERKSNMRIRMDLKKPFCWYF